MKVLFRKPLNQPLQLMEVENTAEALHDLLGGYMSLITIRNDILCICDEDGSLKNLGNNYWNDKFGWIVGNVIFCGMEKSEFVSLTEEQIEFTKEYIGFPVINKIKES